MPDLNPEQVARQQIDAQLVACGWLVQASFSGTSFRAINVLLPPLVEQTRIVAEAERRLRAVEKLKAVVYDNLQRASRQSILQMAFAGEL